MKIEDKARQYYRNLIKQGISKRSAYYLVNECLKECYSKNKYYGGK